MEQKIDVLTFILLICILYSSFSELHSVILKLSIVFQQNLVFYGVIRFYLEDNAEGRVATKCVRVCSSSSTQEVIETLSEKFRPDMKMLSTSYSLYEIQGEKGRNYLLVTDSLITGTSTSNSTLALTSWNIGPFFENLLFSHDLQYEVHLSLMKHLPSFQCIQGHYE